MENNDSAENFSNPIEVIKNNFNGMTNMQMIIAEYIIKHPVDVSFMTLEKFAGLIDTSTTTIMRLMYHLGYSGYAEFQRNLQAQLRDKMGPPNRLEDNLSKIDQNDIWLQSLEKQLQNIQDTFAIIDKQTLDDIVDAIPNARRICFVAVRGGMAVAVYMNNVLGRMFGNCQILNADAISDWCSIVSTLDERDLVFVWSFPRYARRVRLFLQAAQERKARVVLTTDSYSCPLAPYSTWLLPCTCGSLGFHNSLLAALMVADCIITATSLRFAEVAYPRLKKANDIMTKDGYSLLSAETGIPKENGFEAGKGQTIDATTIETPVIGEE
jgi:DNA-binding MurR/RpiR family transcriptional regulator